MQNRDADGHETFSRARTEESREEREDGLIGGEDARRHVCVLFEVIDLIECHRDQDTRMCTACHRRLKGHSYEGTEEQIRAAATDSSVGFLDESFSCSVFKMSENGDQCFLKHDMTSWNILFCSQCKYIEFTVREDERNQRRVEYKTMKSENFDLFPCKNYWK